MTYGELGQARGISAKSAERLVRRRRWPRQVGNDGIAHVLVPLGEDVPAEHVAPRHHGGYPGMMAVPDSSGHPPMTAARDIEEVVREAIRDAVTPLTAQLERAEQRIVDERSRADRAEQLASDERVRADRAEQRAEGERTRADLVELTIEVERRRADDAQAAERTARDEATDLHQRLDQLTARGWWARLRNK
jgi:hypothetical protein